MARGGIAGCLPPESEAPLMNWLAAVAAVALASVAAGQEIPKELVSLTEKARLDGRVTAWCRAEFRRGHPDAFAAAVVSTDGSGRYIALHPDATVTELASYKRAADLSCYTRKEAEKLGRTIKESETIHGQIRPRWNTTVVCGFIDDTSAICWQYSPVVRAFVKVGEWVT
jgi:hypothetical protein